MADEFDDLYAAQLFLATERLRAAARQELAPLFTLAGGNRERADELELFVRTQDGAAVMLMGPETATMRARLDEIDREYRRMMGDPTVAPPALETEDAVAADLAAYRAQPRPAVRSLIVGDDALDVAGREIGRLRDHPHAGLGPARRCHHAADVVLSIATAACCALAGMVVPSARHRTANRLNFIAYPPRMCRLFG